MKYDRRYLDPIAAAELEDSLELNAEWAEGGRLDPWRDALTNANIGNVVRISAAENLVYLDASTFRPIEVCRVQVPVTLARTWIVSWSASRRARGAIGTSPWLGFGKTQRTYAVVRWGIGGGQHQVVFDWGTGGQCAFYGSYVQLSVQPFGLGAAPDGDVDVIGTIAPGESRGPNDVFCTIYYGTLAAGGNLTHQVPPFARQFKHAFNPVSAVGADPCTIDFFDVDGVAQQQFDYMSAPPTGVSYVAWTWDPVVQEASVARFINQSANAMSGIAIIYRLGL